MLYCAYAVYALIATVALVDVVVFNKIVPESNRELFSTVINVSLIYGKNNFTELLKYRLIGVQNEFSIFITLHNRKKNDCKKLKIPYDIMSWYNIIYGIIYTRNDRN